MECVFVQAFQIVYLVNMIKTHALNVKLVDYLFLDFNFVIFINVM